MESRRIVYYNRNTISRSYSRTSVAKRLFNGDKLKFKKYIVPKINKTFATKNCMWCPNDFEDFMIVCPFCSSCQYCGLKSYGREFCQNCYNQPDEKLDVKPKKRRIRVF